MPTNAAFHGTHFFSIYQNSYFNFIFFNSRDEKHHFQEIVVETNIISILRNGIVVPKIFIGNCIIKSSFMTHTER